MELSSLNLSAAAEQGYTFNLVHPVTGEKLDGTIKVRGDKSKVVQAFARNRIRAMQLREKVQKGKNKDTDLTIEELEDMAIESAIVRIITWSNIKKDGEEIPFTKENAEMVLREHDWIRQQIQENAEDLSLFRLE